MRAVFVAQLSEQSLQRPEDPGSNPAIIINNIYLMFIVVRRENIKEKERPGMAHFKND